MRDNVGDSDLLSCLKLFGEVWRKRQLQKLYPQVKNLTGYKQNYLKQNQSFLLVAHHVFGFILEMLFALRRFITGERTGNWSSFHEIIAPLSCCLWALLSRLNRCTFTSNRCKHCRNSIQNYVAPSQLVVMFYVEVIVYQLILSLSRHLCGVLSQLADLPMAGAWVIHKEPNGFFHGHLCWYELSYARSYRQRECNKRPVCKIITVHT